jgi:hypothetical protein
MAQVLVIFYIDMDYIGVGKSRFTVVHMEKYIQVMIIKIALLTQKK